MDNKLISVVVIIVVVLGGFFLFKNEIVAPTDTTSTNLDTNTNINIPTIEEGDVVETQVIKEFSVDADSFYFSPATMTVDLGDTVKITITNVGGTHDFRLDEFTNTFTRVLNAGEQESITFIADKRGTFEYYCSVGNHRARGMVGTLIVR